MRTFLLSVEPCQDHKDTCHQMTEPIQPLGRYPPVGDNTHQRWHKERHKTLHGKERTDMMTHPQLHEMKSHTRQVCPPYAKLQEAHQCQTYSQVHCLYMIGFL